LIPSFCKWSVSKIKATIHFIKTEEEIITIMKKRRREEDNNEGFFESRPKRGETKEYKQCIFRQKKNN
jgi:hypothetical protein